MCGIAGFIDFNKKSTIEDLKRMAACMPHRGPDGQGEFLSTESEYQIGFCHRRLSIIDLSHAADQPMHYENLSIVFNGEIYNYNEIRDELISLGHQFNTHSDTEVILHCWQQWGEASIHKWRGMFAIVIYDRKAKEVVFIRDRPGVKPMNYYFDKGLFIFGSEFKNLMAHPAFVKDIDHSSVANFLQYGYVSSPASIFKNTFKLMPGHLMRLDLNSRKISKKQYWNVYDYYNKPKLDISKEEAIGQAEKILTESFQYRMVADVPVGVFLSGGYDSTCVTSLLQRNNTEKIKTFTIGVKDGKLDEAPYAKEIAQRLGTDHTELYCTIKEGLEIIPQLPEYYDEPFADASATPTILVSRLAKQEVTVALSADAGDEIFAGYNRYGYVMKYGDKISAIPSPIRKMASKLLGNISSDKIPFLKDLPHFHSRYDKIKNFLSDTSPSELMNKLTQVFNEAEIGEIMHNKTSQIHSLHNSSELLNPEKDPLSFMMAIDYQTYMLDDILQKVDRATMSASLEGREPFLDQNIIEWAATLPSNIKFHDGTKKFILKEIVHKYIPKEMMERPKMGFAIPVKDWLLNELKPLVMEQMSERRITSEGIFNAKTIQGLLNNFYNGRTENFQKIWHILMFQLWYERWMK